MTKYIDYAAVQKQVEQLYLQYGKCVEYHIKGKMHAYPDAVEDIMQEVFLSAQRYLKDPTVLPIETPKDWLIGIADNECASFWRKKKKQPKLIDKEPLQDEEGEETVSWLDLQEDKGTQTERLVEERELVVVMNEKIATFSPARLQAVDLHYVQGLSYEEIAVRSGRKPRTVAKDARKGREQLRKCLLEKIDGD